FAVCLCIDSPIRRSPSSTFFPYTTLFRSSIFHVYRLICRHDPPFHLYNLRLAARCRRPPFFVLHKFRVVAQEGDPAETIWLRSRSEEHTSELQSRENLVCRLLLETKKSII